MTRVGWIGLGSQGAPMARRIAEEGCPLTLWARRRQSVEPFSDMPTSIAASPAELGAASDVVGVCVVGDADVEQVLLGGAGRVPERRDGRVPERGDGVLAGMAAGGVVAIHSTVHPDTCQRIAEEASRRDIAVVDAPVSGGGKAAAARRLLVMVGGEEADVARCRPVFDTFADRIIHVGPLGSGQMVKVLNNGVFTAAVTLALEAYRLAEELGMDRSAVAEVLAQGSGATRAGASLAANGFDLTNLRQVGARNLEKDLQIMVDIALSRGAAVPKKLVGLAEDTLATLRQ